MLGIDRARLPKGGGAEAADIPVWPENLAALELFLACETQWRVVVVAGLDGGRVVWQGLDYPGVEACQRRRGGWKGKAGIRLWEDIQVMERAALNALNSRPGA